jgi:hypothetical protein
MGTTSSSATSDTEGMTCDQGDTGTGIDQTARPRVNTFTTSAPADTRILAHSTAVAPVVKTSSTSKIRL